MSGRLDYCRLLRAQDAEGVRHLWSAATRRGERWRVLDRVGQFDDPALEVLVELGCEKTLRWVYGEAKRRHLSALCFRIMQHLGMSEHWIATVFGSVTPRHEGWAIRRHALPTEKWRQFGPYRTIGDAGTAAPAIPGTPQLTAAPIGTVPMWLLLGALEHGEVAVPFVLPDHGPSAGSPLPPLVGLDKVVALLLQDGVLEATRAQVFFCDGKKEHELLFVRPGPRFPIPDLPWCSICFDTQRCRCTLSPTEGQTAYYVGNMARTYTPHEEQEHGNLERNEHARQVVGHNQTFTLPVRVQRMTDDRNTDVYLNGIRLHQEEDFEFLPGENGEVDSIQFHLAPDDDDTVRFVRRMCQMCWNTWRCPHCLPANNVRTFAMNALLRREFAGDRLTMHRNIWWRVQDVPDMSAQQAPYPVEQLENIEVRDVRDSVPPTASRTATWPPFYPGIGSDGLYTGLAIRGRRFSFSTLPIEQQPSLLTVVARAHEAVP